MPPSFLVAVVSLVGFILQITLTDFFSESTSHKTTSGIFQIFNSSLKSKMQGMCPLYLHTTNILSISFYMKNEGWVGVLCTKSSQHAAGSLTGSGYRNAATDGFALRVLSDWTTKGCKRWDEMARDGGDDTI